eukprot:1704573-Rhodomonas_salina.4
MLPDLTCRECDAEAWCSSACAQMKLGSVRAACHCFSDDSLHSTSQLRPHNPVEPLPFLDSGVCASSARCRAPRRRRQRPLALAPAPAPARRSARPRRPKRMARRACPQRQGPV